MKALSLWQPWASVIFYCYGPNYPVKPDETRGWPTKIRGRVAIHAAKRRYGGWDSNQYRIRIMALGLKWETLPLGCIVGTAEIVDCQPAQEVALQRDKYQLFWGDYRMQGDDGKARFAFILRDPIQFLHPVPWKGRQGFFEVPDEVLKYE